MGLVAAPEITAPAPPLPRPVVRGLAVAALLVLAAGAIGVRMPFVLAPITLIAVAVAARRFALQWRTLVGAIVLCILFIPIRRYELPGSLPFSLEPYRLLVALVAALWVASLLVDPKVRLRATSLEAPLLCFAGAILLSVAANVGHINELGVNSEVVKRVTFFVSFFTVMYMIAGVLNSRRDIDAILKLLVGGGAVVAFSALIESRTHYNAYNHLSQLVPLLRFDPTGIPLWTGGRGGQVRAYASAQHSIALGAALVMLVPLAIYLAVRLRTAIWYVALALLILGAVATVSRTAMMMLLVEVFVYLWLKPRAARRLWPLALPLLVMVHIAMPGVLGSFKNSFFPAGGLIAEQQAGAGTYGSGRIADLGPGAAEFSKTPIAGQGFGTRITDEADPRYTGAPILDDQWLGLALEAGILGVLALLWLFVRAARRLGRAAKRDPTDRSWLCAGLAAAVVAYAVGMATFDAFAFIQVSFLAFILLGIAGAELSRWPARAGR